MAFNDGWDISLASNSSAFSITEGNRRVARTGTGGTDETIQSFWQYSTGKWYYEIHFTEPAGFAVGHGIVESAAGPFASGEYLASDTTESEGAFSDTTIWYAANSGYREATVDDGDKVCVALDLDNNVMWVKKNAGSWFGANSTAGDPETNVRGRPISASLARPLKVMVNLADPSSVPDLTSAFKSSQWTYSPPAGFSSPLGLDASIIKDLSYFSRNTVLPITKGMTILTPANTDNIAIFRASEDLVLREVRSVVRGTSPSATFTLYKGQNRNGTSNTVIQSGIVCTSTTSGNSATSFSAPTISAGDFVWVNVTAVSGTVDELHMSLRF